MNKNIPPLFSSLFFAVCLSLFLLSCSAPNNDSFLEDRAGLLSTQEKDHLQKYHQALLIDFDIHFKLIILEKAASDINSLAVELFGRLGDETHAAKGVLFLVDPIGEQVRVEIGYDLESVYPDIFVGYLERTQMKPFFEAGKIGNGIEAITELFISRVQQESSGNKFNPAIELDDMAYMSGGAGANISVEINSRPFVKDGYADIQGFDPQESPEATLQAYKNALRLHIKNPNLGIFTPKTREFFSQWVVTDGQQNHELRGLNSTDPEKLIVSGKYAVIRYPINKRLCSPYFLEKSKDGWMLDFWSMNQYIQMNHKNMWRFKSTEHHYMFGFLDWKFDKNGFPHSKIN